MSTLRARSQLVTLERLEDRRFLSATGTVSGRVFNDADGNGFQGIDETPAAGGFHVFLDANYNGKLDAGEMEKPISGTGTFTFSGVPAGIYQVRQLPRDGWRQTAPSPLLYYKVTVGAGTAKRGLLFGDTQLILIRGTIFMDANVNHKLDPGEPGLPGWQVYVDLDHNGMFDAGDTFTTPNADGTFELGPDAGLKGGTYTIGIVQQSGYRQTAPLSGTYTFTLVDGGTISHRNFGEKRLKK